MLRSWRGKLGEKCPLSTLDFSVLRIFSLDVFLEIPELEASPEKGQQLQQKDKKRRKRRGQKIAIKLKSLKTLVPFSSLNKILISVHTCA